MADEIIQDPLEAANYLLRQYRDNPQFELTLEEASLVHGAYGGGVSFIDSKPVMDEASTASFLRSQDESDPTFIASPEEFSILKATEPGAISRIAEGAAGAAEYFKPVITEGIPELIKTASMREPRPGEPSLPATLLEAGARGTVDLGMMAAGASKFIEKAPYMAAGALGLQDDYKSYLNQKTIDQNYQMQAIDKMNAERAQGKSIIGLPEGTFAPKAAEAASMVLDPTLAVPFVGPGAKATAAGGRALRAGTRVAGGIETAARATGGAIDLGVEKIGETVQRVLPGVSAPKTVGAIATGAAAIGIPGAFPIGAKIAGARAGAEVVERGAQATRIAGEEILTGPSRMTVMERVAKNQKNPEWLRKAANTSIVSSPITQGAAELGLETGKGAVKSAAVGAGLGYVASGGEEEGIGGGLVIGGGLGGIGGAVKGVAAIPVKKALAKQGDVNRLFARQADLGLDVNKIADYVRKDNRPFLDAATLQMMAPDVQVEFHGRDSFMMPENAGINAAGVVKAVPDKSGTTRLLVNMDDMRSSGDTVKHEIMHAIMKSPAINKAEGRMAVMSEYGEEGLRRFGNEYARKLLEGERQGRGTPTEAEVRAKANELREGSQRSEPGAGDLDWIADEVLAEQFVGEFRGKDLDSLRRKTIPGTNLLSLQEGYLAPVGRLLNKFGIDTTGPKPTNIDTLFKDNPLVPSKQLRELTTRWFRDRDKYLDGLDKAEKQKDVVLVPGAGNKNLANNPAIKFTRNRKTNLEENDFAVKFPDGTVRPKDPASILAVDKARVADVGRLYNPDAVLERGSPEFGVKIQSDGKPYVGGNTLPEGFFGLDSFNDFTKEVAKTLQDSRQEGRTFSVWYQKIGTGEDGSWAQSVKRGLGNIKVGQSEIAFLGWRLSKAGNILAQAVDISALRGRMLDFARSGKGRINEVWGGDLASYEKDVMQYLDNHANERPGETGIGIDKRNAINYLFGITNIANKDANPMYATEGRPPGSLVKSYRLDRIANSRDTGRTGFFFDYQKQAANLAPATSKRVPKAEPMQEESTASKIVNLYEKYDFGDENLTQMDVAIELRKIIDDSEANNLDKLESALKEYESAQQADAFEYGKRSGEPEFYAERLMSELAKFSSEQSKNLSNIEEQKQFAPATTEEDKLRELASSVSGLKNAIKFMTPDEQKKLRRDTGQKIVDIREKLPSAQEFAEVAIAGEAKRGWYRKSTQALIDVFDSDAPRFAALLAALSPQTSVESNLVNALKTWTLWTKEGRPQSTDKILNIMAKSVQGSGTLDSVLGAWRNNSIEALTAVDPEKIMLSGPKVNSFMLNLRDRVNEVTNDAWMATFSDIEQTMFSGSKTKSDPGKGPGYLAMSSRVREAAQKASELTGDSWTPAEIQETVWSFAKTLYEMRKSAEEKRTMVQIVKEGGLTGEKIGETPDFSSLLRTGEYRDILVRNGYEGAIALLEGAGNKPDRGNIAGAGKAPGVSEGKAKPSLSGPVEPTRGVLSSAKRLDTVFNRRLAESLANQGKNLESAVKSRLIKRQLEAKK
jgi:hypothetical protein